MSAWGWDDPQYDEPKPEPDEDWEYEAYRQRIADEKDKHETPNRNQ